MKNNGVVEYNPVNEKFNPDDHEAMFKYPDDSVVIYIRHNNI